IYLVLIGLACFLAALMPDIAQRPQYITDRLELRRPRFWVASVAIMLTTSATGLVDGALPLHFASKLTQAEIGGAFAGLGIIVAFASAVAGHLKPRPATGAGVVALVFGIELAGASGAVEVWLPALAVMGFGIGIGQTGATGLLLGAVPTERIVSAMVVWSQMAMVGYLVAPVAGGALGQTLGYRALGIVPAVMGASLVSIAAFARKERGTPHAERVPT
ncbi:MAG: MFS transporter, partial [Acidimicrobiales bacterium]